MWDFDSFLFWELQKYSVCIFNISGKIKIILNNNKTETRATINKQNKTEKTNTIPFLINTDLFSKEQLGGGFVVNGKKYMTA